MDIDINLGAGHMDLDPSSGDEAEQDIMEEEEDILMYLMLQRRERRRRKDRSIWIHPMNKERETEGNN